MRYDYAVILAFLYTGAGLTVYGVTGSPRLAALSAGILLVTAGIGFLVAWIRQEVRR